MKRKTVRVVNPLGFHARAAARFVAEASRFGSQITVVFNGQKTADLNNGLFAEGAITLQYGSGVMKFRKVAIKPL